MTSQGIDSYRSALPQNVAASTESSSTTSSEPGKVEHDLFVVHAAADASFVHGYLLPAVGLDPERVLLSSALALGMPKVAEIERGVQTSRLTLVVLTPAYMVDRWAVFGEQIAVHASGTEGRLVPLLRADCPVPLRLDFLVALDFRDPARWADEARRLRARLEQPVPTAVELPCPYPGMRAYSADIAAYFHGRQAEVDEIIGRLRAGEREIYVIGPSGSGKSSLVAAGVVPRLTRGVSGLGPFVTRTLRPGEHPTARLGELLEGDAGRTAATARALLARHAPDTSILIFIDQLEELFALTCEDERALFMSALRALRAEPRCVLVLTLRADFYGAFMESQLWEDLGGRISRIDITPLRGMALRSAIERPARDLGVFFEPALLERLLGDAASEPGILPLLQDALSQLWDRRRLQLLMLADYQSLGDSRRSGLAVAIARRADATLRTLTSMQEPIARRIFLRLVSFGEGRSDTRRQQGISALRASDEDPAAFNAVLRRLIDDRLVTTDADDEREEALIDLAHEVMIEAWPTLAGWIQHRRRDEQHRRELEAAAKSWEERGRGAGGLLDATELAEADAWRRTESARELGESPAVAALVAASRAAHDTQHGLECIRRRRLIRGMLAIIAVLSLAFSIVLWQASVAADLRDFADAEAKAAESQRHTAEQRAEQLTLALAHIEIERNPTRAIAMVKPLTEKYWPEVRLIATAARAQGVAYGMPASDTTMSLELSRDGTRALAAGSDGAVRIYDLSKRTWRAISVDVGGGARARFAAEERRVVVWRERKLAVVDATSGAVKSVSTKASIVDLEVVGVTAYWVDDQRKLWQLDLDGAAPIQIPLPEPIDKDIAPSPDGRYLALFGQDHLLLLDRTRPTEPIEVMRGATQAFDWSTDGTEFGALFEEQAILGSTEDGPHLIEHSYVGPRSHVTHGNKQVYVFGPTGISGRGMPLPRKQFEGVPVALREARGGAIVAGSRGRILVLSPYGDRELTLPAGKLELLDASPRSPYVVGAIEGRLLVWNLDDIEPRRVGGPRPGPMQLLGANYAIVEFAGTGTQWLDLATGKAMPLGEWSLASAAASPSGHLALAIDDQQSARLIAPDRPPEQLDGKFDVAGFATDHDLLLGNGAAGTVHLYDPRSGRIGKLVAARGKLLDLAWNHAEPAWAAALFDDRTLWRRNLATGAEATTANVRTTVHLQVRRDGTVLYADGRTIRAWRPGGAVEPQAELPRRVVTIRLAGPDHLLAILDDDSTWLVDLRAPGRIEETESVGTTARVAGAPRPQQPQEPVYLSMAQDTGTLVVSNSGGINVVDTLGHHTWTLAVQPPAPSLYIPSTAHYANPRISTDGSRVIARLVGTRSDEIVAWSLPVPRSSAETARWVESLTNATIDQRSNKMVWR